MASLFSKIISREIPASVIHEDERCIVILDIAPVNKGHALIISRQEYETMDECPAKIMNHLMEISRRVVSSMERVLGIDGYNLLINNRRASGQEIPHLHIHIIPRYDGDGKTPLFKKEQYRDGEADELAARLKLT